MRLAFVGPLPPASTGIADYAADVLGALAPAHEIVAYHGGQDVDASRLPPGVAARDAAHLTAEHARRPYDAVVHQLGNGLVHAFQYPLLARVPGLLVLHDLVLHHSRARMLLDTDPVRYAAEVAYSYPAQAARLVRAQRDTVGDLLPYAYPLFRLPAEAARVVAVHNAFMARAVRDEVPGADVVEVAMPMEPRTVAPGAAQAVRARHGIAPDAFVVGCFGLLTREKQVALVAGAVARAAAHVPGLRLLLVGEAPQPEALGQRLAERGVRGATVITGRVPFAELAAHLEACDMVAHLRYPTARETSAALLRALAQGRPAAVSDLENLAEIPADAVVRLDPADEEGDLLRALLRLSSSPKTRARLGRAAAAYTRRAHSRARCLETYEAALARTASALDPRPRGWPAHWAPADAR
jgi:glycosyltransferase involved in cell wall biosynthesis